MCGECRDNLIQERCCSCVVGRARRNMYTMRRSSGRTAQCWWWLWRLSGPGGYRVVASCDLRARSWGRRVVLYYYYAGWVDATVLSRYKWEWRDLVAEEEEVGCVMELADGLIRKRRCTRQRCLDADHGMARSRDSTLGRRGQRYSSSVQSRLDGSVYEDRTSTLR